MQTVLSYGISDGVGITTEGESLKKTFSPVAPENYRKLVYYYDVSLHQD